MGKTPVFRFLKEIETLKKLHHWWASLDDYRGDRARLRRAERPEDVILTEPFFRFLKQMPEDWAAPERLLPSAMVCGALAHVRVSVEEKSFAAHLASPKKGGDKPRMSELRFQQLQKSRNPDEFFRRLLRAIHLAENSVNIMSLAESILHWMNEYRYGVDRKPQKRLAVKWATDYYMALP